MADSQRVGLVVVTGFPDGYAVPFVDRMHEEGYLITVVYNIPRARPLKKWLKKLGRTGLGGALLGWYFRKAYHHCFGNMRELCLQKGIPFHEIRDFDTSQLRQVDLNGWDLGVSMGNGYIPQRFIRQFRFGMINVHHEILPDYPGAQSVVWPLIEGRAETGFSVHRVDRHIDRGDIIAVFRRPIAFEPTFFATIASNYRKSLELSIEQLCLLCCEHPDSWAHAPNSASRYFTTPPLAKWILAFRNYRSLKAHGPT